MDHVIDGLQPQHKNKSSYPTASPKKKRLKNELLKGTSRKESEEACMMESEIDSRNEREESAREKKKKLKAKVDLTSKASENEKVKSFNSQSVMTNQFQEDVDLLDNSSHRTAFSRKKKKKKRLENESLEDTSWKESQEGNVKSEMDKTKESEEPVRKKQKKLKAKVDLTSKAPANEALESCNTKLIMINQLQHENVDLLDNSSHPTASSRKKKKKKRLENESLEDTSRKESQEGNVKSEMDKTKESEEPVRKKQKKLKAKVDLTSKASANEALESCNTQSVMTNQLREDIDLVDNSSQPIASPRKKKKRLKSELLEDTSRKESQEGNVLKAGIESTTGEEPVRKKKLKAKVDLTFRTSADAELESLGGKETEKTNVTMESEKQRNGKSDRPLKKKKKKNKATVKHHSDLALQNYEVETVYRAQELQTIANVTEVLKEENNKETQTGVVGLKWSCSNGESVETHAELLEQLKEFFPNIASIVPLNANKMIKYDLPRFMEFKSKGIPINKGKFTVGENKSLRKNVEDFMALTQINDATKLFFTHRFKEEKNDINKLKRLHKFFEYIAEGIPRSCYYIYARGRRMFDNQNYKGRFSKSEINTLRKLHTLYGSNWKIISEITGRSANSLEKRFAQLSKKEGVWSKKELKRLVRAVKAYIVSQLPHDPNSSESVTVKKETLYRKLPWMDIAAKVKTRSWTKCREKWMSILTRKMSSGSVCSRKGSLEIKIKLIKAMYEMEVEDVSFVNWDTLTKLIGNVPPMFVQRKWHKIKVSHVPAWQTKSFADTVDFLYEKVLPSLEQRFSNYKGHDATAIPKNKESFLLTELFQDVIEKKIYNEGEDGGERTEKQ